jgi:hypothetical protein
VCNFCIKFGCLYILLSYGVDSIDNVLYRNSIDDHGSTTRALFTGRKILTEFHLFLYAARNLTQDLVCRILLRHGNHQGMLEDKT